MRVLRNAFGSHRADLLGFMRLGRGSCDFAQKPQSPLADDARCLVGDRGKNTADLAAVVSQRAVREGEVSFFRIAEAIHHEEESLVEGRFGALEDCLGARADQAPYLPPHVPRRLAEGVRVLLAEKWPVRIVVEV